MGVRCKFLFLFMYFFLLKWNHFVTTFLWNHFVTQNVLIIYFYPPTLLKRHFDVLRDKLGMDVTPYAVCPTT